MWSLILSGSLHLTLEIFWIDMKGCEWEFHDPVWKSYFHIFSNEFAIRLNLIFLLIHPTVLISCLCLSPKHSFLFLIRPAMRTSSLLPSCFHGSSHKECLISFFSPLTNIGGIVKSGDPGKANLIYNLQISLPPSFFNAGHKQLSAVCANSSG